MEIIPAIDILGGRCVRLTQGDYDRVETFDDDPVEVAGRWAALGAQRLHVVDLDGARRGEPVHVEVLERIVARVHCPVQFGGGVRTLETARAVLATGVDRAILGTVAVEDSTLVARASAEFPGRIAVGIDARGGRVAVRGWRELSEYRAVDLAVEMERLGTAALIYTDILKDGTLSGPNLAELRTIVEAVQIPVIASGGVGSLADLLSLLTLQPLGLAGAIVGRALYTGDVDLGEALRAVGPERWQDVPPADAVWG
jgi:phosphoribosylformimino-5-aminoimidazole carboxamide ribotide isomerase